MNLPHTIRQQTLSLFTLLLERLHYCAFIDGTFSDEVENHMDQMFSSDCITVNKHEGFIHHSIFSSHVNACDGLTIDYTESNIFKQSIVYSSAC